MKVMLCDACGYRIDNDASVEVAITMRGTSPRADAKTTVDYCETCAAEFFAHVDAREGLSRVKRLPDQG